MNCLFCRNQLTNNVGLVKSQDSSASKEHIVPRSLTGFSWLTTNFLCRRCNNQLGTSVDSIADGAQLPLLRHEAGIEVGRKKVHFEKIDPGTGEFVPGYYNVEENNFEKGRKVTPLPEGVGYLVEAPTETEVQRIAESLADKARSKGMKVEIINYENQADHFLAYSPDQQAGHKSIVQLAAKVAIEYIAMVAGLDVGLAPTLDFLRDCALAGTAVETAVIRRMVDSKGIWLPRTRRAIWFEEASITSEEEAILKQGRPISGLETLASLRHSVRLVNDGTSANFELELFSLILVHIPLPRLSALTFRRRDYCDLLTRKRWTQW